MEGRGEGRGREGREGERGVLPQLCPPQIFYSRTATGRQARYVLPLSVSLSSCLLQAHSDSVLLQIAKISTPL